MPVRLIGRIHVSVWMAVIAFVVITIGLRDEIGGDWQGLLWPSDYLIGKGFHVALAVEGPSYGLLNWVSVNAGLGIYGVNLVCAALFVTGLAIFCRSQPIPWLTWLIATPYLLIVVGMGYTRQSVALGLLLWALVFLEEKKIWRFVLLILIGATFHKSVLLMSPLVVLGLGRSWWIRAGGVTVLAVLGWLLMSDYLLQLWNDYFWRYVGERPLYSSRGAFYRIWMNAVPATILLLAWRPWKRRFGDPGFWNWLAIAAIGSVVLVGIASTAVDRINLYIAPIQLYVWSRFPLLFGDLVTRTIMVSGVIVAYFVALWFWLYYAENAYNWVPYKNVLLG